MSDPGSLRAGVLRPMADADRRAVARLWQLYSHDLSEFRDSRPNAQGLFRTGRLPSYFDDRDSTGFVITRDGSLAGFAFVMGVTAPPRHIGDFFVVRHFRRHGLGYAAARELLDHYPGPWEIGFQVENRGVPDFWRRVVTDVVGDRWREVLRPVPDKPHIPHDHFLLFTTA